MNCNQNSRQQMTNSGSMAQGQTSRFPVGMGYVPMQQWEAPYPIHYGFTRGTIFPSLDYPFMRGGCR